MNDLLNDLDTDTIVESTIDDQDDSNRVAYAFQTEDNGVIDNNEPVLSGIEEEQEILTNYISSAFSSELDFHWGDLTLSLTHIALLKNQYQTLSLTNAHLNRGSTPST